MNIPVFVILYLALMIPTYLWRYASFGASMLEEGIVDVVTTTHIVLLINYFLLVMCAYFRGRTNKKTWITTFPFVAGVFDLVLVFIPFIPTVMNVITIVFGVQEHEDSGGGNRELR